MKPALGCCLLLVSTLAAQTVRVSSPTAAPGEETTIAVSLESPPDQGPVTLQMDIEFPAHVFSMEAPPVVGSAAKGAGKSAACNGRWKKAPQVYLYRCIVAGGVGRIPDGDVLVMKGKIPASAKSGKSAVKVDAVLAVDAKAGRTPLKPASGSLSVTRK